MATVTWGLLQKSQVDPELIEEAINRIVAAHNDDEAAHIGEGRSLDQHKLSEVIDHVVASIVADKIKQGAIAFSKLSWDKRQILSVLESLDGWVVNKTGNGTVTAGVGQAWVGSGNIVNEYSECYIDTPEFGVLPVRNPLFQATLRTMNNVGEKYIVSLGRPYVWTGKSFGFKMNGSQLYAVHWLDGVEYSTEITGITITSRHTYRAQQFGATKIDFYIDGVLKVTHTENLSVVGPSIRYLLLFSSKCLNGGSTGLYISECFFQEDKI